MGRTSFFQILMALLLLLPMTSSGQNPSSPGGSGGVNMATAQPEDITDENFPELIESFDYPNADLEEVVKAISKLTKKNFIIEPNVRGKITIIAPSQITVAEAYKAFLSALAINGFTVVPSGKFLKIRQARDAQRDSIETYSGEYFPNTDQIITRIIKLKYISADEVQKNIRNLSSKNGEIQPYPPTNSLIITDFGTNIERIAGILNALDVPGFEEKLAVIRIRYARSKDIADLITQIINKEAKGSGRFGGGVPRFTRPGETTGGGQGSETYSLVVPDDRTNSIVVVGNDAGIKKVEGLVAKLDFPLRPEDAAGIYVYYVRYGDAKDIADVLNGIAQDAQKGKKDQPTGDNRFTPPPPPPLPGSPSGSEGRAIFGGEVKVTADKTTNSLVISSSRQDYESVKSLLAKLDRPRDQVFVKAVIMEMTADNKTDWGVNYYKFDQKSKGLGRVGFSSGNIASLLNPIGSSGAVLGFGGGDQIEIVTDVAKGTTLKVASFVGLVNFLKSFAGANVLSEPQIMAIDNEEANIEVGTNVTIGKDISQAGTGNTLSSPKREDATINMTLTPYISADSDTVRLKIDQKIKQVANAAATPEEIVLNKRALKTQIIVNSGDTAVLGGLMADEDIEGVIKVPILGDIPILGWLFKGKNSQKIKRNLLVLITPKIVRNTEDNAQVLNNKLNERIKFIQKSMNGRDPFGEAVDALPRRAEKAAKAPDEGPQEEPAVESF